MLMYLWELFRDNFPKFQIVDYIVNTYFQDETSDKNDTS